MDVVCIYTGFVASQCGTQSFIGLIMYTAIVHGFLSDIFIFKETLKINEMIGAGLILATTMGVSIYKLKDEKSS